MYPFATFFIQRKVLPSPRVATLPRILLYPILKLLLLLEYYGYSLFTKGSDFSYYKFILPKKGTKRISDDYREDFSKKKLVSLRTIVLSNRPVASNTTDENRVRLMTGL